MFYNGFVAGTAADADSVFRDCINSMPTVLPNHSAFVKIHNNNGTRIVIGYVYTNKLFGGGLIIDFLGRATIVTLNNGTYSSKPL